jgi:MFS family permease
VKIIEAIHTLRISDFKHFALARFLYITALRMLFTIVSFLVYDITKSKWQLGLIGLAEVIPAIGLALYAGVVVDKSNKRSLILKSEWSFFVCTVFFILAALLYNSGNISSQTMVALLLIGMVYNGVVRAFNGPAHNAIIAQLVPKEWLVQASTLSSVVWLASAVVGPLLAGIILHFLPIAFAFTMVSILVLFAIANVYQIKPTEVLVSKDVRNWDAIKEGLRFVYKSKIILSSITLDMFAVLFGGAVALLPVYAKDILQVNEISLGWLTAAEYIGSFIIMLILVGYPFQKKQGMKLIFAVAGFGLCTILFAISTHFWISFFALVAIGLFDGVSVVIRSNIMQLYTPDEMRGRVNSVNSMFINSSNEIGQFESGMAAEAFGTVRSVVIGGIITLLVVVVTYFSSKSLRQLEY